METITVCCATCDFDDDSGNGCGCAYFDEDFDGRCMNWSGRKAVEAWEFREACKRADAAKANDEVAELDEYFSEADKKEAEIELLDLDTYDFADIDEDD